MGPRLPPSLKLRRPSDLAPAKPWRRRVAGTTRLRPARCPGAAALVAGDDAGPAAGPGVADEASGPARMRQADRNVDGNRTAAADTAGHLAAAGRRDLGARNVEGRAVGRAAIAGAGGEGHVPGAVIGAGPWTCIGRGGNSARKSNRRQGEKPQRCADLEIRK